MAQSSRHLRERRNGLCGCLKVVFFAHTATHVRARESEGTACVVVVSGTRFESFFCCFVCMYGHARTGTHLRACTSYWKFKVMFDLYQLLYICQCQKLIQCSQKPVALGNFEQLDMASCHMAWSCCRHYRLADTTISSASNQNTWVPSRTNDPSIGWKFCVGTHKQSSEGDTKGDVPNSHLNIVLNFYSLEEAIPN